MAQATLDMLQSQTATDLANIGLAHAANALSFMLGEKATFEPAILNDIRLTNLAKEEGQYTVLFTPFIGDVLQESFLVLGPADASKMADALTPSPGPDDRIRNASLLEIDNIISASLATQLANIMDESITGDVPRLLHKHVWEVAGFLSQRVKMNNSLHCGVTFRLPNKKINAYYLTVFKPSFSKSVQSMTANQMKMKALWEAKK